MRINGALPWVLLFHFCCISAVELEAEKWGFPRIESLVLWVYKTLPNIKVSLLLYRHNNPHHKRAPECSLNILNCIMRHVASSNAPTGVIQAVEVFVRVPIC
ncbi:hypothetical protein TWF694_009324 [Orbilia ellipsospora]|uniref:Secreted protein n=1 Tax=Orbilia ellipsospora TaxID=2528407 RepID=A0AAV9XEK0_9PEZI